MLAEEYPRNAEFVRFINRLAQLRDDFSRIIKRTGDFQTKVITEPMFVEDMRFFLNKWRLDISEIESLGNVSIPLRRQLGKIEASGYPWYENWSAIVRNFRDHIWLMEDYFSDSANKIQDFLHKMDSNQATLSLGIAELYSSFISRMARGYVDNCVVPYKATRAFDKDNGTIVGFDLTSSRFSNDEARRLHLDEARRIAFRHEAYEWTDAGDGYHFLFYDHEGPSIGNVYERALRFSVELISKLTYSYPLDPEEIKEGDVKRFKAGFQQLRVVINSFENDDYPRFTAFQHLLNILHDVRLKFSNTIFIIGDDTLNNITNNWQTYKAYFSRATQDNYKILRQPLYWAHPIGLNTLQLYLKGAHYLSEYTWDQRDHRYQISGVLRAQLKSPNVNGPIIVQLMDISRNGIRLRIDGEYNPDFLQLLGNDRGLDAEIDNLECDTDLCEKLKGKIVDHLDYHGDGDIIYLRMIFSESIAIEDIYRFLTNCNNYCLE